jgi:hypothetical protein
MIRRQFDAIAQAPWDDHDFAGARFDCTEFGDETGAALLRYDRHFTVGIVKEAIGHGAVGGIDVHRHADLGRNVAIAAKCNDTFDEVGGALRNRNGTPAQLCRVASANGALRINPFSMRA